MVHDAPASAAKGKGSRKARAGAARLAAVQAVFESLFSGRSPPEAARDFLDHYAGRALDGAERLLEPDRPLFAAIVEGVGARRSALDDILKAHLKSGGEGDDSAEKKIDNLLRSILLCGCYEMLAHTRYDPPLLIAEYLHVTRAFYEGRETALVNAVLDSVAKLVRPASAP